jgi:hypothetical protein
MTEKVKFELEFLLRTSPRILENKICTPSGLSEWFADNVNIAEDIYTFSWDGSEERARCLCNKQQSRIKFRWLDDEASGNDCFFELAYTIDPITKAVVLNIIDHAEEDELEQSKMLWEQQLGELKRLLGA